MHLVEGWWQPDHMNGAGSHIRRYGSAIAALKYLSEDRHGLVMTAGAHIGTWVKPLSKIFESVHCWEPMSENMECLIANCGEIENVHITQGCLGKDNDLVHMRYSARNTGKHCVETKKISGTPTTKVEKLDDYFFSNKLDKPLDALFLDVEGYELYVLMGAHVLIHNDKPLILCEENACAARYGIAENAVESYLNTFGYRPVERWGEDVIYVPRDWS